MTATATMTRAMASLILLAAADASGQIILIPTSAMMMTPSSSSSSSSPLYAQSSSSSYYDEPPCRQRRLEPLRQLVREMCLVEALEHCRDGGDDDAAGDRRALPPARDLSSSAGSLLDAIFASGGESSGTEDPFDRIVEEMMNWSLRAFDDALAASSSSSSSSPSVPGASTSAEEDVVPIAPEVAAENALDVAVASLARRSIHGAGSEEGAAVADAAASADAAVVAPPPRQQPRPPPAASFADVDELHDRLFRLGSGLLSERGQARVVVGDRRRRLLEGEDEDEDEDDPRARVRERLARRLTEYRVDLFYHPDGAVTVYTRSSSSSPSPPKKQEGGGGWIHPPPLGTGSDHVDACLAARYANGDLRGGCLDAVDAFAGATTGSGDVVVPPPSPRGVVVPRRRRADDDHTEDVNFLGFEFPSRPVMTVFFVNLAMLSVAAFLVAYLWDAEEEDADDDEEDGGGGEFDYEILPEGDDDREDGGRVDGREGGGGGEGALPRVYVGVPLQVV